MTRPAICVRDLSKRYQIGAREQSGRSFREAITDAASAPLRRLRRQRSGAQNGSAGGDTTLWALKDVGFDIRQGEVVGVIGRNGAGKSTLLKILSRITEPTTGEVYLTGRVGSLLEVGTGFHPELTGRENIYLNGSILGMTRREIDRQFDAIVDFAGIERFLDTPVKRYSNGMYVRLAFAVAAHLDPEILLVDEVLAVGDIDFQRKCLGKLQEVTRGGRTVLFVSHQMQAVSNLCTRAVYLESGQIRYFGDVGVAVDYHMNHKPAGGTSETMSRRWGTGELRFRAFVCDKQLYHCTDDIHISAEIAAQSDVPPAYYVVLQIVNHLGTTVFQLDSRLLNTEFAACKRQWIKYAISNPRLAQGDYKVNAYLCTLGGVVDYCEGAADISIAPILPYPGMQTEFVGQALVYPQFAITESIAEL